MIPKNSSTKGMRGIVNKGITFTQDGNAFAVMKTKNIRVTIKIIETT